MFNEYETFRLSRELLDDKTIPVGTRGVVLMVFGGSSGEYEVEFPDGSGGNLGKSPTYTIGEEFMKQDTAGQESHSE